MSHLDASRGSKEVANNLQERVPAYNEIQGSNDISEGDLQEPNRGNLPAVQPELH
jgi:hypothetical protein